ncbi:DpnD/PcfM family protein [Prevotella communis]|uniref:DpnD/PcfM family protein n=1 Tax=Prevotella communis TaxID=2913614 RepID=UPI001EDBE1F3|nr:DpnD/PcfM family protein [Prevotella communis]UKK68720.1 DpnD/PcfM family protein [Prevotella communis]UKK71805.1 DpnD/PcfM family protein [Prevotella communis]
MKKYSIEVLEVLSRIVEVEASDEEGAIKQVRQKYRKCEIVLDDSDYKETEFSVKDEKSE